MRISVEDMRQSEHKRKFILNSSVMLDGKLIDLCNVTCVDEEAGCIEQYAVRDGKYVIDQSGEWPETEKVYGVVKIIEKAE